MIKIRIEKFLKNMKVNFIFYLINIGLSFVARSIFIKFLGTDITGLNSLYLSLIGLLNVAELGVGLAVGYSLYDPLSKNNFRKIDDIMVLFKYYYNRIAKIILILGVGLSLFLPLLIKGQINIGLAYIYYYIYLVNCAISYIFTYKQTLIIADQKQYKITYVINITKIIKILVQCLVIYLSKSFFLWILCEGVFNLMGMILANKKIDLEYKNRLNNFSSKSIELIKKENYQIKKNITNVFFHKIGGFVVLQTDSILISIFSTLKETAIYANYMMIINALTGLLNTAVGSIMPSIGNLIVEESKEKSYDVFKMLFLFDNILSIVISIITYELINQFIVFWIGDEYLFSKYIVLVLIINLYIQISRGTVDRFKDGFGIYWDKGAPIVESIINLFTSIILANKLGIIGIFIGTIVSNMSIILVWKPYILFKQGFNKSIIEFLKISVGIYIRNIIIFVVCNNIYREVISKISIGNNFINIVVHATLVLITSALLIIILFINSKEFKRLIYILNNQLILKIKNRLFNLNVIKTFWKLRGEI